MSVSNALSQIDAMVSQGQIVEAVDRFFADRAETLDFDGTRTSTKAEMIAKMNSFVGSIQQVNGITLHRSLIDDQLSLSEFTFDFTMNDNSQILWHEIIRREWQDGQVINEQYFKN